MILRQSAIIMTIFIEIGALFLLWKLSSKLRTDMFTYTWLWHQILFIEKNAKNLNKKDGYRQRNVRQGFCKQPKAHYLATSGQSRRYVVAFTRFADGGIWLRQESLRHILASPWYAPGTIAVNVIWMERGFNAGPSLRSMCPSIFNRLRAIERYWSEIATFFYPPYI